MHAPVKSGFPQHEAQAKDLIAAHGKIEDEPLLLAVYFAPERDPEDVFILEVLDGFGGNAVSDDGDLFEVTYGPSPSFPLEAGRRLHLILTNPTELRHANEKGWTSAKELRRAKQGGQWKVLHEAGEGEAIERAL